MILNAILPQNYHIKTPISWWIDPFDALASWGSRRPLIDLAYQGRLPSLAKKGIAWCFAPSSHFSCISRLYICHDGQDKLGVAAECSSTLGMIEESAEGKVKGAEWGRQERVREIGREMTTSGVFKWLFLMSYTNLKFLGVYTAY